MGRVFLRLMLAVCVTSALLLLPGGLTTEARAVTADTVRDDDGDLLALAQFYPGLEYWHKQGKPGPGVNAFRVLDFCGDGKRAGVSWKVDGATYSKDVSDACESSLVRLRSHTVKTGFAEKHMKRMSWYVWTEDKHGNRQYGREFQDDWMGSYSYEKNSKWFAHSSVYRTEFTKEEPRTVTVTLLPSADAVVHTGARTKQVWEELEERTPLPDGLTQDQRDSLYKQLWCHMQYAVPPDIGGPTWDLEAGHPNIPWDEVTGPNDVARHHCNWGYDDEYSWNVPPGDGGPPADLAPLVDAGPDVKGAEGAKVKLGGVAQDDGGRPETTWSYEPVKGVDAGTTCRFTHKSRPDSGFSCTDDGTFEVTLTADDGVNRSVSDSAVVTLKNVAPRLKLTSPDDWDVHRVEDTVTVHAPFTDPGTNDMHTCTVRWDDGKKSTAAAENGSCDLSHVFRHAGMNTIQVEVTDDDKGSDRAESMVVVYDPRAGLLTGAAEVDGLGFGVAAKYPAADSTVPAGAVALSVPSADGPRKMVSTALDWLVINPEGRAAVKGRTADHGFLGYVESGKFRGVVWPLSHGNTPPDTPLHDTSPGADWDMDRARPKPVSAGVTVIDSGWLPGLPPLPEPLGLGPYLDRLPKAAVEVSGSGESRPAAPAEDGPAEGGAVAGLRDRVDGIVREQDGVIG
ncbi:hypothetical protein RCO28_13900 [Streptomyces sp. LHD-70]|uniref:hypothetical protein n=1 Tax=Streptomyces sp. LHD-70 TaxID=3072140 RepID=UPI00280CFAB4|nr:hypothetical protein [Streptomyces sp. LHD-70]MDQ8703571.1 hypothetical protein [Streptomyces sp. LHD-70]